MLFKAGHVLNKVFFDQYSNHLNTGLVSIPFEIRTGIQMVEPFEYRTLKSSVFRWIRYAGVRYSDGYCISGSGHLNNTPLKFLCSDSLCNLIFLDSWLRRQLFRSMRSPDDNVASDVRTQSRPATRQNSVAARRTGSCTRRGLFCGLY